MKITDFKEGELQFTQPQEEQQSGGVLGRLGNIATNLGLGIGTEIGKTGIGLGQTALKGVGALSEKFSKGSSDLLKPILTASEEIKKGVYEKPFEKQLSTTSGKVGQTIGTIAEFMAPNTAITKGQQILSLPEKSSKIVNFLQKSLARGIPEYVGSAGVELARTGGDIESSKDVGMGNAVASIALGTLGDIARATYYPQLKDSVSKAFGIQGKKSGAVALKEIDNKIAGLAVIKEQAPNIKVKGNDGVLKTFNPSKASYNETLQAWNEARKNIYNQYHNLTKQANKVIKADLSPVLNELNAVMDGARTTPYKNAAKSIYNDIVSNFGVRGKGFVSMSGTDLLKLEGFLQDLNVPAAQIFTDKSNQAYGEIAALSGKKIREIMDEIITNTTGSEYQIIRSKYAALKSVEDDLVRKFQQEARKIGGGGSDYVGIFSSGDIIAGFLSSNPSLVAKGGIQGALATIRRVLGSPERFLRRSFDLIDKNTTEPLSLRLFGGNYNQPLTKEELAISNSIKNWAQNPKIGMSIQDVSKDIPDIYKGEKDLTTKILKDLEGKTTVSKQYILDATNRPELKQTERDLIRQALESEGNTVNVNDFAKKVKAELLPLKLKKNYNANYPKTISDSGYPVMSRTKFESVSLPSEIRGNVKNYDEHLWESPIKTSAGQTHFPNEGIDNYFGHTRIEDMADNKTRRVIEVQSDLYQKGNLEKEALAIGQRSGIDLQEWLKTFNERNKTNYNLSNLDINKVKKIGTGWAEPRNSILIDELSKANQFPKLQQYNDPTAHFRMVREEIKKAAQDGKTKLQFPTGETAMKIEGLGENVNFYNGVNTRLPKLTPQDLKVGKEVYQNGDTQWIITDVLGDGKFKAVPKDFADKLKEFDEASKMRLERGIDTPEANARLRAQLAPREETFDISGKVDTNNPIYKFYEKDVQKYLNKFGGKRVVDDKGVSWIEVPITKEQGKMPVEAFGIAGLGIGASLLPNKSEASEIPKTPTITTKSGIKLREVPESWKEDIKNMYEKYSSLKKYKGIIEAILMQESSMGTIDKNYNPKIGESAWIAGFTDIAKKELGNVDLDTQKGVIEAVARLLDKKRIVTKNGKQVEYKDPVNLYLQRYKTKSGMNLSKDDIKRFREYVNYYSNIHSDIS